MATLEELMGKEIYHLLYIHYDKSGFLIEDIDDVLYCEDEDIPLERIEKLKVLLTPVTSAEDALIPLEAARLLAAWGAPEAIDYFEYSIDKRIDRLGNLAPHRLHGYDTTYEVIGDSAFNYYARCVDNLKGEQAKHHIEPLLKKIIHLSKY